MRILIVSNTFPPRFVGGAELMAREQAKALTRLGHEVQVFAGDLGAPGPRHGLSVDHDMDGIPVHRIATLPEDYSPEFLNFLHPRVDDHFRAVLSDFAPDIVHCHNLAGLSVKLPIIARQHGARVVCTLHDYWGFCPRNTAIRADGGACDGASGCRSCQPRLHDGRELDVPPRFRQDFVRLAFDHVDRFVAPSRHVAGRYLRAGLATADRIVAIPNGIAIERFHPASPPRAGAAVRITYVGYLGAHKGVATLLEAVGLMPDGDATLQLVGEGPEAPAYLARMEALGLGERVRFLGRIAPAGMPGVYAASDIVVLPSMWDENQPVCLMEAMAAGLPVVASRKGGIPELIEHGRNGLMVAAGDAADLAAALTRLVRDPALRRGYGSEGRRRVEGLGHDRQAGRVVEVYADLLGRPATACRPRRVFAAVGPLHARVAGMERALANDRQSARYFMPRDWIADCVPTFGGILLTGRGWHALRRLGINAVIGFPWGTRTLANALLRRLPSEFAPPGGKPKAP